MGCSKVTGILSEVHVGVVFVNESAFPVRSPGELVTVIVLQSEPLPGFRSVRMGAWCFARPGVFFLAQTSGCLVSNSGEMVLFAGGEEYSNHSSLLTERVIMKEEEGIPASFS